jgi:hypothetical protein
MTRTPGRPIVAKQRTNPRGYGAMREGAMVAFALGVPEVSGRSGPD